MNGKDGCDTGGAPPQSLTKCQSALLDEWLDQSRNSEKTVGNGESKGVEEMEEERQNKKATPLSSGCITCPTDEDTFRERKTERIGPEEEAKAQEAVVPPIYRTSESHIVSCQMAVGNTSQEEIGRKRNYWEMALLVAQGGESVSTNENQDSGVEVFIALAELGTHPHSCSSNPQEPPIMDCPVWDLRALLAENQTWDSQTQSNTEAQPELHRWHFPVGHGLADMVHRPYWQFPAMSYYPALQESTEFKVMWRVWEDLDGTQAEPSVPPTTGQGPESVFEFTVMSYNILAQYLLEGHPELYIHCSDKVLVWSTRLKGIIQEIKTWRPDILCLQEAQEIHFQKQLQPVLSDLGYTCVYKRRTGSKTDGCAVCYQHSRFFQLSVSLLELRREGCELLDRDNVAIVLLLQPVTSQSPDQTGTPICVATTHLLFNPRRGDIKLAQLVMVLAEVDNVVRRCKAIGRECEVVLCGDFNSFPNMPLYQFIKTGQLYYHGLPTWMISGQEDLSHQTHPRRVYAPLLPSSLGINDNCQYVTAKQTESPPSGKLKYSQGFLLQLRYCPGACERPRDLALIPGVTDNTPDQHEKQPCTPTFSNTVCHCLNLSSAYSHFITGTDRQEVTTLHSNAGATVDYIFYSARTERIRGQTDKRLHGGLEQIGRLALLTEDDLWSLRGLPNEVFPSDHLSLLAKFKLRISPL
ncbi:protein angel homolog 1 isoform X4 [Clupea harengus]|nr:protein angel homolog 1 isoform X4 [Clupea harengus]XP_031435701.1 protein angel homolog 1 isoform X4 [Clupea harengus]XP_031435702.1 protein angel homolog 1 isoform X4 [Clupea harengus]